MIACTHTQAACRNCRYHLLPPCASACLQEGKPLVLGVVREAERRVLDDPTQDKVCADGARLEGGDSCWWRLRGR